MPQTLQDHESYIKLSAIVNHAALTKSLERTFPGLPSGKLDEIIVAIIDRMARMRGWEIKRENGSRQ